MSHDDSRKETFEEFRKSFSYGSRADLNFKFLKSLPDEEAGLFFQELLWKLGDAYDHGDLQPLIQHAFEWQAHAYSGPSRWAYESGPFTFPARTMAESKLALVASSGHFVQGEDPQPLGVVNMTQEEAQRRVSEFLREPPFLSEIPWETPKARLRVRHPGYDVRGARADANVTFPYERLRQLAAEGVFAGLANNAYSFVGTAAQTPLLKETGPQWLAMLQDQQVDAALLVPV